MADNRKLYSPKFIEEKLDPYVLRKLIAKVPFIEELLSDNVVLAGGAVLWAYLGLPDITLNDMDMFILNTDSLKMQELAKLVDGKYPNKNRYYSRLRNSIFTIHIEDLPAIQFIFSWYSSPEQVIASFDMEPVQCAIYKKENEFYFLTTIWALESYQTRKIRYILDESYVFSHLQNRIDKLFWKGFCLPPKYEDITKLPVHIINSTMICELTYTRVALDSDKSAKSWEDYKNTTDGIIHKNLEEVFQLVTDPIIRANYLDSNRQVDGNVAFKFYCLEERIKYKLP